MSQTVEETKVNEGTPENVTPQENVVVEPAIPAKVVALIGAGDSLFKKADFAVVAGSLAVENVIGRQVFPADANIKEINDQIEKIRVDLMIYEDAPAFVLSRAMYPTEDEKTLAQARFSIRPAASSELADFDLSHTITLLPNENFYTQFIREMGAWFDRWTYSKRLQNNLNVFNAIVADIIEENEIPFSLKFVVGSGIIDATDDSAVIGLSGAVVRELADLPLFDRSFYERSEAYYNSFADVLKGLTKPFEIVKSLDRIVKNDLQIYTRKGVDKLIRNFVKHKLENLRVGVGYYEQKETLADGKQKTIAFALVERKAVTAEEAAVVETSDNVLVTENSKGNKKELADGKTKIVSRFILRPYSTETGEPLDITLAQLLQ